jgi:3-phosphoshikimate 1-carboxyvinyltransferase
VDLLINPGKPLRGEVTLPGDKSISHRAALFGALADGESRIENFLLAGVTRPLLDALTALGARWELGVRENLPAEGYIYSPIAPIASTLRITGAGFGRLQAPPAPIDCANSGATLRFLAGALAAAGLPAVLDGSEGLRRRPMSRVVDPLQRMGAPISAAEGGRAPLVLMRRPAGSQLRSLDYKLPVASAQVKTALVLAALQADGPSQFWEPHRSRDHTERLLGEMGADIENHDAGAADRETRVRVAPLVGDLSPLRLEIPGDFSSAAFLIVAALITPGSEITLRGVGLNPTRTGLLGPLEQMGGEITVVERSPEDAEPCGDMVVRYSLLRGAGVSGPAVVEMIDEIPVFGVAAAYSKGISEVSQAGELRYKESDRIASLCRELSLLGCNIEERPDGFALTGGEPLNGGMVRAHGDHRLEMALVVAGLAARGQTRIQDAGLFAESYPGFLETLRLLGAEIEAV